MKIDISYFLFICLVLDATKFELMNKEGERCEEKKNYSFTYCIRVGKCPERYPGEYFCF